MSGGHVLKESDRQIFSKAEIRLYRPEELDLSQIKITRAGVIPFCKLSGERIFLLGLDSKTREITDFGGKVEEKDSDPIIGAWREFSEETLGTIPNGNSQDGVICYSDDVSMLIIFVELSFQKDKIRNNFSEAYSDESEILALLPLEERILSLLLDRREEVFFYKIVPFLRRFLK